MGQRIYHTGQVLVLETACGTKELGMALLLRQVAPCLQAAHYLMMQQSNNNPESHNRRTMKFAAVSSTAQ